MGNERRRIIKPINRDLNIIQDTMQYIDSYRFGGSNIPRDGLVAEYLFSGNADDTSGNGYNGTVNGATLTTDRKGNANSAYEYSGVNPGYIETNWILPSFLEISQCYWIKFDVLNVFQTILDCNSITARIQTELRNNGTLRVVYRGGDITFDKDVLVNFDTSNWFFVVQTAKKIGTDIEVNIYKDGVNIYSLVQEFGIQEIGDGNTGNLAFGSLRNIARYFNGKLDDIRIYNRVLTPEEITLLYEE